MTISSNLPYLRHSRSFPVWVALAVSILPLAGCQTGKPHTNGPRVEVLARHGPNRISAQVVNPGGTPIRILGFEWYHSHDTLSVLVREPETGKCIRLQRLPRLWAGPTPKGSIEIIEAGRTFQFQIDLYDGTWERRRECDYELAFWQVCLEVESHPDDWAKRDGVFVGKMRSEWFRDKPEQPWFLNAPIHTRSSIRNSCVANLKDIQRAKAAWAAAWDLEHKTVDKGVPDVWDLTYKGRFITHMPVCPWGGKYTIGQVGDPPTCSIPEHTLRQSQ
jgi:hypothetical protein